MTATTISARDFPAASWQSLHRKKRNLNRKKILFTGLIPIGHNYYYGDNVKPNNKKDFLVIYYNSIRGVIHLYIFENRSPRKKADFANDFVYHLGHIGKLPNNI